MFAVLVCFSLAFAQAQDDEDCKTLIEVGEEAGLSDFVESAMSIEFESILPEGPVTIFAPSQEAFRAAFEALGFEDVAAFTENQDIVREILRYHVVEGVLKADDLSDGDTLTTTLGEDSSCDEADLTVQIKNNKVTIKGAESSGKVEEADIETCLGIIHRIDAVLLPCPL